jgi:hypothetical protein
MADKTNLESPVVDAVTAVMKAEADVLFTHERLERQRARILQRINDATRPGQVIAFPYAQAARPSALRIHPGMRWVAAAAAAGLFIGVVAGHLAHVFPSARTPIPAEAIIAPAQAPTLQAVSTTMSEEEFLGALEIAIESTGGSALRPLDDLTPMVDNAAQ